MSSLQERAFQVVTAGDLQGLISLLKDKPDICNAINAEGISLLLFAVYNRKKEIADLLVRFGATLDVFSASAYGALNDVVTMTRFDPDLVYAYSSDGWTPLHLASFFGNMFLIEYLVMSRAEANAVSKNSLKNQPLHAATVSNHADVAEFLLKKGADVNFAQHGGITPLHAAAYNGNETLVGVLLAHGANPNVTDDKGETPIDKATQQGHNDIVSILQST